MPILSAGSPLCCAIVGIAQKISKTPEQWAVTGQAVAWWALWAAPGIPAGSVCLAVHLSHQDFSLVRWAPSSSRTCPREHAGRDFFCFPSLLTMITGEELSPTPSPSSLLRPWSRHYAFRVGQELKKKRMLLSSQNICPLAFWQIFIDFY